MPSQYEALGGVFLEAWSFGKAVVGGTAYGARELIEDNGAGVISSHEPGQLAQVLISLLSDEPLLRQMGERGRELVQREFSKGAVVRGLEDIYRDAIEAHRWRQQGGEGVPAVSTEPGGA